MLLCTLYIYFTNPQSQTTLQYSYYQTNSQRVNILQYVHLPQTTLRDNYTPETHVALYMRHAHIKWPT